MKNEEFKTPDGFPKPFGKNVIVARSMNNERKTKTGIIIPSINGATDATGIVMEVGYDCSPHIKPGQLVIMSQHVIGANDSPINQILHDGEAFLLVHEVDIFCHVPPNTAFLVENPDFFKTKLRKTRRAEAKAFEGIAAEREAKRNNKTADKIAAKKKKDKAAFNAKKKK